MCEVFSNEKESGNAEKDVQGNFGWAEPSATRARVMMFVNHESLSKKLLLCRLNCIEQAGKLLEPSLIPLLHLLDLITLSLDDVFR